MDQRRLRAVLWDFDGTLVDSEPMWIEHEKDMLARHGASWSDLDLLWQSFGLYLRQDLREI